MKLLVIYEKVEGTKNTYHPRYELYEDDNNALFRKTMLFRLNNVRNVEIIPIEIERIIEDVSKV